MWGFYVMGTCYNLKCNIWILKPPCASGVLSAFKPPCETWVVLEMWHFQKFIHYGWWWLTLCKEHMENILIAIFVKSSEQLLQMQNQTIWERKMKRSDLESKKTSLRECSLGCFSKKTLKKIKRPPQHALRNTSVITPTKQSQTIHSCVPHQPTTNLREVATP